MMSEKVNSIPHNDQQLKLGPSPSHASQVSKRELTDDDKIDAVAAWILERYREAFLELAK